MREKGKKGKERRKKRRKKEAKKEKEGKGRKKREERKKKRQKKIKMCTALPATLKIATLSPSNVDVVHSLNVINNGSNFFHLILANL